MGRLQGSRQWWILSKEACSALQWGAYKEADSGGSYRQKPVVHSYGAPTRQQIVWLILAAEACSALLWGAYKAADSGGS
jgi:uncharacterized protein YycO